MTENTFWCPRGAGPDSPFKSPFDGHAHWREDGTCSYCGSMKPAIFLEMVEDGREVIPTDKDYKVYVRPHDNQRKFYFQHFNKPQINKFVNLLNQKKVVFAHPGHFYVKPFFIA